MLDFSAASALELHNRVRGFAGWPGTSAAFVLEDEATGEPYLHQSSIPEWDVGKPNFKKVVLDVSLFFAVHNILSSIDFIYVCSLFNRNS